MSLYTSNHSEVEVELYFRCHVLCGYTSFIRLVKLKSSASFFCRKLVIHGLHEMLRERNLQNNVFFVIDEICKRGNLWKRFPGIDSDIEMYAT